MDGNKIKLFGLNSAINGIDAINIAQVGVANPRKDSVCRLSTLNLANLMAENKTMRNAESKINRLKIGNENENCLICMLYFSN